MCVSSGYEVLQIHGPQKEALAWGQSWHWHLLDEPVKLLFVFWTAKVCGPGVADGELVEFQHVHDANLSDGTAEQLRSLVHTGS